MNWKIKREGGFSIIEIMIVVLIIGIGASMAVLYIDTSDERLKFEARRLFAMTQLARDDAIIKSESLGLVVHQSHYYFTRFENSKWIQIVDKPYRVFELSSDIRMRELIKNESSDESQLLENKDDLIYFLPTGESSEFQIWIGNDNDSEYVLSGTMLGELSMKKTESL